jgi:hypothetical protein
LTSSGFAASSGVSGPDAAAIEAARREQERAPADVVNVTAVRSRRVGQPHALDMFAIVPAFVVLVYVASQTLVGT